VSTAELAGLIAGLILLSAAGLVLWAATDCRPRVLALRTIIRLAGTDEAPARAAALRALVPDGIELEMDLPYDPGDRVALLDVFRPAGTRAPLSASLLVSQPRGVVLMCGAYDLTVRISDQRARRVTDTLLWAYSGKKRYSDDPAFAYASVAAHVTADFPPSLISAGNGRPRAWEY
jgi:hypothetical protein